MHIYRTESGVTACVDGAWYLLPVPDWDAWFAQEDLYFRTSELLAGLSPIEPVDLDVAGLQAPIGSQEVWACGVTYYKSRTARMEESEDAGGGDFYARVYSAERPELFFKSSATRVVGPGGAVRIRRDSTWDVPEPELTLALSSTGKINGYTIGNDMSSRSIEGENPLYLPQAKTYDGSAALGPCVYLTPEPLSADTTISIEIHRDESCVFEGEIEINQIKRSFEELAEFLFRETSFPQGAYLMTGTGVVPGTEFTLLAGDVVTIRISGIGTLTNRVAPA